LENVEEPIKKNYNNLLKQTELMEYEFDRCQAINRKLVADLVLNIEKLNAQKQETLETTPN
jgi:hypothetical protein